MVTAKVKINLITRHTIKSEMVKSVFTRVMTESPGLFEWSLLAEASPAGLFAFICWNAYFINKIYDVDMSKLNKHYLGIAAGEVSVKSAWLLVIFYLFSGLIIMGLCGEPVITALYCLGLFLGTIYSLTPLIKANNPLLLLPMILFK
ncbi:hypothetical protein G4B88_012186 [Cannabis sativa]|uniref:Uncharacterized protein n=1 Tax=Cannabis sativa TaxID=3483 RepID=A0A7J6I5Q8_CANSA|nr:hypothetical protein G4B88_012186 [Cannabis sativa]